MKISPVVNQYFRKTNFTSSNRTTYFNNFDGEFSTPTYQRKFPKINNYDTLMVRSNSTSFFRDDLYWEELGETFKKQFPKGKVNLYDFACSDGSEAFSLIITLMEQLGQKEASRFLPIVAVDIDPEIIRMAKSGKIMAGEADMSKLEKYCTDISKYFQVSQLGYNQYLLSPKEILTKNVIFKQQNATLGLGEINKDENNIIVARNFWKYLPKDDLATASWNLGQKANDKTLLIIGTFDCTQTQDPFFLTALGFSNDPTKHHCQILTLNEDLSDKTHTKDETTWKKYIYKNYFGYVPDYIKRF